MEKTYELLNHSEPLPICEIRRLYKGRWVYIVKAELGQYGEIISGVPVITGEMPADGVEDGIYDKYKSDEYNIRIELNLLPNKGFISALRMAGEAVG